MSESQDMTFVAEADETSVIEAGAPAPQTAVEETLPFPEDVLISEMVISDEDLAMMVESLLLVSPEPPLISELAQACEVRPKRIEQALETLTAISDRGWVVVRHGDRAHLASSPRYAAQVRRFLGLERETRLSGPSLEALAVIAYRQPVTRSEIESVRGVDCSGVLATLHARGLIEISGRLQTVGNPLQYSTTPAFLHHFGLTSLAELPDLGAVNGTDAGVLLDAALAMAEEMPAPTSDEETPLVEAAETAEGAESEGEVEAEARVESLVEGVVEDVVAVISEDDEPKASDDAPEQFAD